LENGNEIVKYIPGNLLKFVSSFDPFCYAGCSISERGATSMAIERRRDVKGK
jgi:hypothetical protein